MLELTPFFADPKMGGSNNNKTCASGSSPDSCATEMSSGGSGCAPGVQCFTMRVATKGGTAADLQAETWATIGNAAKVSVGNFVPDLVNGATDWVERFTHQDTGSLGRMSPWVDVRNETAQEAAGDIRKVGSVALMFTPLKGGPISTGRTIPNSLKEKLAMEEVVSKPAGTTPPRIPKMSDTKNNLKAEDGWVKRVQNVNGVEIHYVENVKTGKKVDFKFKD